LGKLKALRLGIVKGVQHTVDPRHRATRKILEQLHCLDCGHGSLMHTRVRPAFAKDDKATIRNAIFQTGFPGSKGFHECTFFYCDMCETLACEGHFDSDGCNGMHERKRLNSE